METVKLKSINWWSANAVAEKPCSVKDGVSSDGGESDRRIAEAVEKNIKADAAPTQGTPYIQPLIVVPYSSPMQPLYHYDASLPPRESERNEDFDRYMTEDVDAYELDDEPVRERRTEKREKAVVVPKNTKIHAGALVITLILCIIMIAAYASFALKNETISGYVSMCVINGTGISLAEPAVAMISDLANLGIKTGFASVAAGASAAWVYAAYISSALYALCLVSALITAIAGLAKKDGFGGKIPLVVMSAIMLVCGVVSALGAVFLAGGKISDAAAFFGGSGFCAKAGYGLYAAIAVALVSLICALCVGGKSKRAEAENE
jgi:hypothetical protein